MGFHHFATNNLRRSERIQQWVVRKLLNSKLPNEKRESSLEWELKHSCGVMQIARILAEKRGVDVELAQTAACLHDICVIERGSYKEHAKNGVPIAKEILEEGNDFTKEEISEMLDAIGSHSDKHLYSKNALVELVKDADVADCFFYDDNIYNEKPDNMKKHYFSRIILIRRELGLPDKQFHLNELKRLGGSL